MYQELIRTWRLAVDFLFRRRTIAGALILTGGSGLVAALGGIPNAQVVYRDPNHFIGFTIKASDFLPTWSPEIVLALVTGMLFCGLWIGYFEWRHTRRLEERRKNIIVELRGLHSSPDTPASREALDLPRAVSDRQVIDFRPKREGDAVDPILALEKLAGMKQAVAAACGGRAPEDVTLAVGGLGAVPALFLVGMGLDDESSIVLFDWDRSSKAWRRINGLDDGKRVLAPQNLSSCEGKQTVVLAVSMSYVVDMDVVTRRFGADMPIVQLRAEEPLADRYWSEAKQQDAVRAFTDAIQACMSRGVKRVHLVLAAPSSLAIRMGMAYDRRLMPDLVVHQYERSSQVGYPWGLRMPTHGVAAAGVEWAPVGNSMHKGLVAEACIAGVAGSVSG